MPGFPLTEPVIALVGPTAVGKTALSLEIAESFGCEIVSLDSVQVYRYMDIGTAKASAEERGRVAHHLIDIVDPDEPYDASMYEQDALRVIAAIQARGRVPLVTGGTGLYLRALTEGLFDQGGSHPVIRRHLQERLVREGSSKLHEELSAVDHNIAEKIHPNDTHRLLRGLEIYLGTGKSWSEHLAVEQEEKGRRFAKICMLGLDCDRQRLYSRINRRTGLMIAAGLKEEVEGLLAGGYHRDLKAMQAIGYRHMVEHILDRRPLAETEEMLARDTRRYAKRQLTWFRKMEITWLSVEDEDGVKRAIERFLGGR